jgi:hypothetical protein
MRTTLIVAAFGWLAVGGAASAQVTGVVTQSTAQLQFNPGVDFGVNGVLNYAGQNESGLVYDGGASTTNYQVSTVLAPKEIQFANGATASGLYAYSSTTTSIAVKFTNDGAVAVVPQLQSTILPGGFGFYVGDTSGCQIFSTASCSQVTPASGLGFKDLAPNPGGPGGNAMAGTSFTFTISDDTTTIESLSASLTLEYNAADPGSPIVVPQLTGFASSLADFGLVTPPGSSSAIGYQWGQTGLTVNFPSGLLAVGASDTLNYTTVVNTYALASCDAACGIVSYGGFGDPIGKSVGAGENVVRPFGARPDVVSTIGGVSSPYEKFGYALPTFSGRVLSLIGSAVPEPASWGLMLLGIGLAGVRLRRRTAAEG